MGKQDMRRDAGRIIEASLAEVMPDKAVVRALSERKLGEAVTVLAVGKAAWTMAKAAAQVLGSRIRKGLIITKYEHSKGELPDFEIVEAGHPLPDENSVKGVERALTLVQEMKEGEELLFLLSGGGSSLFEKPVPGVTLADLRDVTELLLRSGAGITEMNVIRKRLSSVKGGKFAACCSPVPVCAIVLSDVVGKRLDMIASGPLCPDTSGKADVERIVDKYSLKFPEHIKKALDEENVPDCGNVEFIVTGSVTELCGAAARAAQQLGYHPLILSTTLECEAREAGLFMASIARQLREGGAGLPKPPCAVIVGGETVVHVTGSGLGGRNQELVLSAAEGIAGLEDLLLFSLGSDGTDGPTDAAGGFAEGDTAKMLSEHGINIEAELRDNNSYYALKEIGNLLITGPTGTNVNDLTVILSR